MEDPKPLSPARALMLRLLLFVAATLAMLIFMPRESEYSYSYEVNRPWVHSLLTARYDIPIHLDSVSARAVKDSIDRTFEPVYRRDRAVEQQVTAALSQRLAALQPSPLSTAERQTLLRRVEQVYATGIVDPETYRLVQTGRLATVRFINGNVTVPRSAGHFLTQRLAYLSLDSLLPGPDYHRAMTAISLAELLRPNIVADSAATTRLLNDAYQKAMAPVGVVQQGERIIDRGDIVTPRLASILDTHAHLVERNHAGRVTTHHYPVAGKVLYIILLLGSLYAFLYFFRRSWYDDLRRISFMVLLLTGFAGFAYFMNIWSAWGIYMVPFTMVPILAVIYLDSRTGFFLHIVTTLVVAAQASFPLEFVFLQFVAGATAIFSIKDLSRRSQLVRSAVLVFAAYAVAYVAIEVMTTGSVDKLSTRMFGAVAINAVLVSFAYVLLFIFERIFGFTSRVTLIELSDINNALLRELSEECPGTFQHSMSVSNLASAAAARIGANVQLVRAGALYHDIGKIRNPAFYTENQYGVNPHDALDPMQSARVVINHVTEGLKMAERAKLPRVIRDFILEHHGHGKAKYFYNTYCNAHPDEEVDPEPFTYPGPNPRTRETSIMMMADAVEAASRSLTDHSPEAIAALVDRIVDGQVREGLHNDSDLSFHDVQLIKDTFVQRLRTMYHSRISYPGLNKRPADTPAQP